MGHRRAESVNVENSGLTYVVGQTTPIKLGTCKILLESPVAGVKSRLWSGRFLFSKRLYTEPDIQILLVAVRMSGLPMLVQY